MSEIPVRLGSRSYTITVARGGIIEQIGNKLRSLNLGEQVAVITSPTVRKLYGLKLESSLSDADFQYIVVEIPDGEENKSISRYSEVVGELISFNNERRIVIVNLGGGVVGDVGGFVAATFKRGVPYVQVPTTLLAQVDCAIGGKVGVNHPQGKNYIGRIYQPSHVFMDLSILKSLPKREICSGLSEVIKYSVALDYNLFEYIEAHLQSILALDMGCIQTIVEKSSEIKARIVEEDEKDTKDIRAKLNFGHTIGHALEVVTDYLVYKHGEAISIGMVCACEIANGLDILDQSSTRRIEKLLVDTGLPVKTFNGKIDDIMQALRRDKKFRNGRNKFILPVRIGEVKVEEDIPEALIRDVIEKRMPSLARP